MLTRLSLIMSTLLRLLFSILLIVAINQAQATDLKKIGENISDTVITTKIKTRIAKDKNLNPLKISVSTDHGIVMLKGYAKNKQAFVDTLRIATSTKGVQSVNTSQLEIKRVNSALADAYITTKVEAAVLESKVLDDESIPLVGINASTQNGIVTLSGLLSSNKAIDAIIKRVHKIHGVKKVISNLELKPVP